MRIEHITWRATPEEIHQLDSTNTREKVTQWLSGYPFLQDMVNINGSKVSADLLSYVVTWTPPPENVVVEWLGQRDEFVIEVEEPAEIMPVPFNDVDGHTPDGHGAVELNSCGLCYSLVRENLWEDHVKWHETDTKS